MVDRQFIVLDNKGKAAPAKRWPHMTLIEPRVEGDQLTLRYPGMEPLVLTLPDLSSGVAESKQVSLDVWGDPCRGVELGREVGRWLSDVVLGDPEGGLRLLYHPAGESSRPDKTPDSVVCPTRKEKDKPYFAHAFPYMMMTQPSITKLNTMLEEDNVDLEVDEKRFRPNILIDGAFPAFAEEQWAWVRVGDVVFRHSQICPRCEFVNVDPEMGDKNDAGEPLKTLKKYRSALNLDERKVYGSAPIFGVNLAVELTGTVHVGDKVFVGESG
jgi:uncharacterized protein YcbX